MDDKNSVFRIGLMSLFGHARTLSPCTYTHVSVLSSHHDHVERNEVAGIELDPMGTVSQYILHSSVAQWQECLMRYQKVQGSNSSWILELFLGFTLFLSSLF